jgi:hypothetical protein
VQLAAGLEDHPFPHRQGCERAGLEVSLELSEEDVLAPIAEI